MIEFLRSLFSNVMRRGGPITEGGEKSVEGFRVGGRGD
jgi:hypothetical protein